MMRRAAIFVPALLALLAVAGGAAAEAADRAALEAEQTRNGQRIESIDREAAPLGRALQDVLDAIDQHNLRKPDARDRAAVDAYNEAAGRLDSRKADLAAKLQALQDEQDRLIARNRDIAAVLASMAEPPPPFSERAAEFVKMLNDVAAELHLPKGPPVNRERAALNCQALFRGVAAALARQGKASWQDDFPNMNADAIARKLAAEAAAGGDWRVVGIDVAQALANQGAIVVGAMPKDASGFGHLGFVFPIPAGIDVAAFHGSGPFVRDGNEHALRTAAGRRLALSTWGAVKASNAFAMSQTRWYVWTPSEEGTGSSR